MKLCCTLLNFDLFIKQTLNNIYIKLIPYVVFIRIILFIIKDWIFIKVLQKSPCVILLEAEGKTFFFLFHNNLRNIASREFHDFL